MVKKISSILKKAGRFGFYSMDFDNYPFKAYSETKIGHENFTAIQTTFNFKKTIPNMDSIKDVECGFYIDGELYTQNIFSKIQDEMAEHNIICIISDIMYYFPETMLYDNHHSTFILLYPINEEYHLIYINSHGSDIIQYQEYNHKITAHRSKKYTFDKPIDIIFIEKFIQNIDRPIVYNETKYHNYYGPNIQLEDNHGVCFIFPFAILIYLSNNMDIFTKQIIPDTLFYNSLNIKIENPGHDKVNNRKIKQLMRISKYSLDEYRYGQAVEKYLQRSQIRYLKTLTSGVIDNLTCKKLREKVT
tara:strand:+ start:325 stop:1233 length:909 start_codon:yes stop_codon:yes gene_type:complete